VLKSGKRIAGLVEIDEIGDVIVVDADVNVDVDVDKSLWRCSH